MSEEDLPGREKAGPSGETPLHRLAGEAKGLLGAYAQKALVSAGEKASQRLGETAHGLLQKAAQEDGGGPGVKAALSGVGALTEGKGPIRAALGAGMTGLKEKIKQVGRGGGKKKLKLTNIVETIDVGVPLRLAYDQWTQFEDFPTFTKKVEQAEQTDDGKTAWKAQVWWSHRAWEATVIEQVPDDHIVWRSKGAKGHVDGAVSFSELAPNLTRICLVMEYHPQGLFEHTGNLWRAQGRRARLELKHFRRHAMAHAVLQPDQIEGWRGEIREGKVVRSHEEALDQEERAARERRSSDGERRREGEEPGREPHHRRPHGRRHGAHGRGPHEEHEEEFPERGPRGEEEPREEERRREEPRGEEELSEEEPRGEEEPYEEESRGEEEPYGEEFPEEEPRGERQERQRRPRRRPAGEEEERPRRPARRRPAGEAEERAARGRQPARRGSRE